MSNVSFLHAPDTSSEVGQSTRRISVGAPSAPELSQYHSQEPTSHPRIRSSCRNSHSFRMNKISKFILVYDDFITEVL